MAKRFLATPPNIWKSHHWISIHMKWLYSIFFINPYKLWKHLAEKFVWAGRKYIQSLHWFFFNFCHAFHLKAKKETTEKYCFQKKRLKKYLMILLLWNKLARAFSEFIFWMNRKFYLDDGVYYHSVVGEFLKKEVFWHESCESRATSKSKLMWQPVNT